MKPVSPAQYVNMPKLNWQDTAVVLLWKLSRGAPVTIDEDDMKQIIEHYPTGPVIHAHTSATTIVLKLLTRDEAKAEGLT